MSFSFNDLDLSGVGVATPGGQRIPPGYHVVKVAEISVQPTKNGSGRTAKMKLVRSDGKFMDHWINLHIPSSAEATRIGREEFKAMLVHGGHPNPDKPKDIATARGMTVGLVVGAEPYTDQKTGEVRMGTKVVGFVPVAEAAERSKFNPDPVEAMKMSHGGSGSGGAGRTQYNSDLDDEIPF